MRYATIKRDCYLQNTNIQQLFFLELRGRVNMGQRIAAYFNFDELGTNYRKEFLAGLTTFISMVYILFVNPNVLGVSGMDKGAVFTATALASAFGCFVMGIVAKYPFAISASLGINAFFAYTVVLGMKVPWQTALAGVFVASILFMILTAFRLREMVVDAIPRDLKMAISAGIGLFIAFIGLHDGGLIVADKSTTVALGSLSVGTTWLTVVGLLVTIVLMSARVPGAIFIGMVVNVIVGLVTGLIHAPAPGLHPCQAFHQRLGPPSATLVRSTRYNWASLF